MALPTQAQDTTRVPSDTLRTDTLRAPADTTARDTTRRDTLAADTLRQQQQTLSEAEAVPLETPRLGRAVTGRLPVRQPALDATDILARTPGAFHYDLGGVGWPHGVSFGGRPPGQTALALDGLSFNDPLTGRPRYDLLPIPFLESLHTGFATLGAPGAVGASLRPYDFGRPLTELRYRARSLQSIGALHTQRRQVRFLDQPALAQFTGGYFGRASDNSAFLPGSDLRRERRLLGRIRYRRQDWALQLMALHNRRRLGANGGVALSEGAPLGTVFARRPVRFQDAQRRLVRTDLAATLRLRTPLDKVVSAAPLTATAYWTVQTHRYRNPALADTLGAETTEADTLAAGTDRYGLRLAQRFSTERLGGHDLQLAAHAWTDRFSEGNALPGGDARAWLHLSARDSTQLLGSRLALSAGVHAGPTQTFPSASARLERPLELPVAAGARLFAEMRLAGQPVSWIEQNGFGSLIEPLPGGQAPGRVLSAEAGGRARLGPVEARLALFADRTTDPLDLYATDRAATARAALAEGISQRAGATLSARWRADAERGFYATADATALFSTSNSPLRSQAAPTVPRVHGHSRLGARYAFFTGDLDVDAYAEGRFWSQMTSRTLHAPTGRLALPPPGAPVLGPAGTLDLHAEATVRTATLFFSYENALSGTQVQRGVLNVPLYPLPAQRFRFGVYWPIFN